MFHFVNRLIYPSSQLVNSAHPTCSECSLKSILKLSSNILLVLPSCLFLSGITRYKLGSSFTFHFVNRLIYPSAQLVNSAHATCSECSLKSILKLSSNILLVLPSCLFLSGITRYKLGSSFTFHFVNRLIYPSAQLVNSAHPTCSECSHLALIRFGALITILCRKNMNMSRRIIFYE